MQNHDQVTRILSQVAVGSQEAYNELFRVVYSSLKGMAHGHLQKEYGPRSINTTALVHECFEALAGSDQSWESKSHFFGVAGKAMRNILVDHARRRSAEKRGGNTPDATLTPDVKAVEVDHDLLISIDNALASLARKDERLIEVVELRFFCGFSNQECASILGCSERTINRDWARARAYLLELLSE